MDTAQLITNILTYYEGRELPTNVTEIALRRRAKFAAQRVVRFIWNYRPWEFRWATASATVTSGVADLPANFVSFGKSGGVYLGVGLPPLEYKHLRDVAAYQAEVAAVGQPRWYSVGTTVPLVGTVGGTRQLLLYPMDSRTVTLVYERKAPTLLDSYDSDDATLLATDGSGLEEVPSEWHDLVIYEGALYHLMNDKGDARMAIQQGLYDAGIRRMVENEKQGRETEHSMPPYRGARRFR